MKAEVREDRSQDLGIWVFDFWSSISQFRSFWLLGERKLGFLDLLEKMSTPLKVWQRWSTPTKATNPDSNGKVSGMVSEIQYEDDPRRLPDRVSELEKEVCFYCDLLCFVRYFFSFCWVFLCLS